MTKYAILSNNPDNGGVVQSITSVQPDSTVTFYKELTPQQERLVSVRWTYNPTTGFNPPLEIPQKEIYTFNIDSLLLNGEPALGQGNSYYASANDLLSFTANIINEEGEIQTQLDQTVLGYPPILKLPFLKMVNGRKGTVVEELYINSTLTEGVFQGSITIPSGGNWKILSERTNQSIAEIGGDWEVKDFEITFLV